MLYTSSSPPHIALYHPPSLSPLTLHTISHTSCLCEFQLFPSLTLIFGFFSSPVVTFGHIVTTTMPLYYGEPLHYAYNEFISQLFRQITANLRNNVQLYTFLIHVYYIYTQYKKAGVYITCVCIGERVFRKMATSSASLWVHLASKFQTCIAV